MYWCVLTYRYWLSLLVCSIDAIADPNDCQRFKLVVRSSGTVKHMYPAEPDMTQLLREGGTDSLIETPSAPNGDGSTPLKNSSTGPAPKPPAFGPRLESAKFLKARGKTHFWQLNLRVEGEQACKLAVLHIENKRKELAASRMQQLRRMLEHWASEGDVGGRDD
jgi:hypothetical protein